MTKRFFTVALACLCLCPAPGAQGGAGAPGPRVRFIKILHKDIFDTSLRSESHLPYRIVNLLHASTKDHVIRKEMLLKEGDPYDPRLARETERALRRILRLRDVRVTPAPVDGRTVDLMVELHETWTTEPTLSLSGVGGKMKGKVGVREYNLFGYGKTGSYFYKSDAGVIRRSFSYGDPNFFRTHLHLNVNYEDGVENRGRSAGLERPFYSTLTPWSAGVSALSNTEEVILYENGDEASHLEKETQGASARCDRSFGSSTKRVRRAGLGYRFDRQTLIDKDDGGKKLSGHRYHAVFGRVHLEKVRFLTCDHIDKYDRQEDFALGPSLRLEGGPARKWFKASDTADFFEGSAFAGLPWGPSHFILFAVKSAGRHENRDFHNVHTRVDGNYNFHFSPRQTLAVHAQYERVRQPDAECQVLLGGDRGLRGYQLNQFSGDKLYLFNVEERLFLIDDILKAASLGAVVFYDSGRVWKRGERVRWRHMRQSAGAGLRIHLSRTSQGHVLRFDWGYALNSLPGEDRWVITFGSSQAF